MNYYAIIEPLVRNKYWSNQYTEGIKQEIQRIKGKYIEITFDGLKEVADYGSRHRLRPVALVNCISNKWIPNCLMEMEQAGIHPLLLTPASRAVTSSASTISFDFYGAFYSLCRYLEKTGHGRIVLLGLNPSSANDVVKQQAFLHYYSAAGDGANQHIFWNHGRLEDCCLAFLEQIGQYDAVICVNDIVAIKLIRFLKHRQIAVPDDIYIAAMGNTSMSELITPKITVAKFDCFAIGRHAAKVYRFLAKNPEITSLSANVSGQIIARESTGEIPASAAPVRESFHTDYVDFYADADVQNIFSLEELFQGMDELDREILHGLLCEKSYPALAETLFTSESTIKYRVKRMIELAGCESKAELLERLCGYMDF